MKPLSIRKYLCLLLFFPIILMGQDKPQYAVANIPDSLMEKVNHVVRMKDKIIEVISDSKSMITYTNATTVFNSKSSKNHVGEVFDPNDGMKYFEVKIYDASGDLVKRVKRKNIVERIANLSGQDFDNSLLKSYKWSTNNYPFTIEYTFKKKVTGISNARYARWAFEQFDEGVESSSITLILPEGKNFFSKLYNVSLEPEESIENGKRKVTWKLENLAPIYSRKEMPSLTKVLPLLVLMPDDFEMAGEKGSMSSWEAYSSFMKKLFEGKDELPEKLHTEIKKLVKETTTDREKIDLIYQYVQENTRYVSVQLGDGGWIPFDASYVYENKYGDCKALTNYTYSLLNAVGISATPTLIYSDYDGPLFSLDDSFVDPSFNHIILYVPGEDCWLECTSSHNPSNYLGGSNTNRKALLIQEKGGKLITTPNYDEKDNVTVNSLTLSIDDKGTATIEGMREMHSVSQGYARYLHFADDEKEMKSWFKGTFGKIANIDIEVFNHTCDAIQPKVTIDFKVNADRFTSAAGKRMFIPVNDINKFSYRPKFEKDRLFNIESIDAYTEIDTFIYKVHSKYVMEKNPLKERIQFSSDFGSYDAQIILGKGEVTYIRKLVIRPYSIPMEKSKELKDFFKKVRKWDGKKMVFKEGGA